MEVKKFSKIILITNVIILAVCFIVLLILGLYSYAFGYLLGSITSYVTYLMHANSVNNLNDDTKNPSKKSFASSMLRFFISAVVLAITLFVNFIDIVWTFIGLMVIKLTIVIVGFINTRKRRKT